MYYIYIFEAIGHKDIYKIGQTQNPSVRIKSVEYQYHCKFKRVFCEEMVCLSAESDAIDSLVDHRSNVFGEGRQEVFEAGYETILSAVMLANVPKEEVIEDMRGLGNRKTRRQAVELVKRYIFRNHNNNQTEAAALWGTHKNVVYSVLAGRRNPTKKMLATLGLKKDSTTFYVSAGNE